MGGNRLVMKFSLVLATVGRCEEVRSFLTSLLDQSCQDFEVIVADQNKSSEVEDLCREYSARMQIKHLRIERLGLSHARNVGLRVASGDVLAFPDDDCEYPGELLSKVREQFAANPRVHGITGVSRDKCTGRLSGGRFDSSGGVITSHNVWRRHISSSMFLRRELVQSVGTFDEQLGVGATFGSGEETDFLLRVLRNGSVVWYDPDLVVYHPNPVPTYDQRAIARAYSYGLGAGAVFRKHICGYRALDVLPQAVSQMIRPLVAALAYAPVSIGRSRCYLASWRGRVAGFVYYPVAGGQGELA